MTNALTTISGTEIKSVISGEASHSNNPLLLAASRWMRCALFMLGDPMTFAQSGANQRAGSGRGVTDDVCHSNGIRRGSMSSFALRAKLTSPEVPSVPPMHVGGPSRIVACRRGVNPPLLNAEKAETLREKKRAACA